MPPKSFVLLLFCLCLIGFLFPVVLIQRGPAPQQRGTRVAHRGGGHRNQRAEPPQVKIINSNKTVTQVKTH